MMFNSRTANHVLIASDRPVSETRWGETHLVFSLRSLQHVFPVACPMPSLLPMLGVLHSVSPSCTVQRQSSESKNFSNSADTGTMVDDGTE